MLKFIKSLFSGGPTLSKAQLNESVIIDVRTPAEYQRGHIQGSVNVPLQNLKNSLKKIKSKNKPVVTCCASGNRSGIAANQLRSAGIEATNGGSWKSVQRALEA